MWTIKSTAPTMLLKEMCCSWQLARPPGLLGFCLAQAKPPNLSQPCSSSHKVFSHSSASAKADPFDLVERLMTWIFCFSMCAMVGRKLKSATNTYSEPLVTQGLRWSQIFEDFAQCRKPSIQDYLSLRFAAYPEMFSSVLS